MQINLNQAEIQEALTDFVSKDFDISGKDVIVTMVAGRGKKGHSANIDIVPKGTVPVSEKEKPSNKKDAEEPDAESPAINFNEKD